jgi:hypothetical protein
MSRRDILAVTETCLNDTVSDSEILSSNFTLYRRDRTGKRGGGILLAVKKSFDSCLIKNSTSHEIIAVSVKGVHTSVLIILCYRPPRADVNDFVFLLNLRNVILSEHRNFENICILGDFNFPDISWNEDNYSCSCARDYVFKMYR